ncbi:hypothetical protein PCANC_12907 [Puccinia coronata f. sp. avenae]|uniref:Uncharacterized protein n=1 Tax=Puccinia coronata f. sp. avenae TaxID=200324 RepID=A0A2N5UNI5_9BASI|nr:hypothetical protein PCANC_12907 [Puccinia coronata f. sp. avenae]
MKLPHNSIPEDVLEHHVLYRHTLGIGHIPPHQWNLSLLFQMKASGCNQSEQKHLRKKIRAQETVLNVQSFPKPTPRTSNVQFVSTNCHQTTMKLYTRCLVARMYFTSIVSPRGSSKKTLAQSVEQKRMRERKNRM